MSHTLALCFRLAGWAVLALGTVWLPRKALSQDWIWSSATPGEEDVRYFRKTFRLGDAPAKAALILACDNEAAVFLDGKPVGGNSEWSAPSVIDLTQLLKAGEHVLGVRAVNHGGPAGLLARLEVAYPTPKRQTVVSDNT